MLKWMRLPGADAAGENSNDTTEVEIGDGITIPTWAKSIRALHVHPILLALTSDEEVAGYVRINDDNNRIDPLNFPLPICQALTGAIATHLAFPITYPAIFPVTPNDILRVFAALDAATTGVHTLQAYILFSSHEAKMKLHAQKSAVIAASATANTRAGAATIKTIADKISAVLGFWAYIHAAGGITAAQTVGGYIRVKSAAAGWQEQAIPTNIMGSGLSTQISPPTKPMLCTTEELLAQFDNVSKLPFDEFPVKGVEDFNFENYMDGTNTGAPGGRYGLIWKE